MHNRKLWRCLAIAMLTVFGTLPIAAADAPLPEYKVKAAIVYKVAKFVSWPESVFDSQQSPLVLCIAGKDPFGQYIDNLDGQVIHGRPLLVRRLSGKERHLRRCHIVFVSVETEMADVLAGLGTNPVLTIGDSADFAVQGGIMGLGIKNNRVTFEINLQAARSSMLDISASLLQLATIVEGPAR